MKKTNFRKATLSALLMLVVAVVSLTGVTYAWFTSGNDASVNDIEVGVTSAEGGLLISKDNSSWTSSITFTQADKKTLAPVSTAGTVENGVIQFFTAKLATKASEIENLDKVESPEGYYIAQDIYFNNFGGQAKEVKVQVLVDNPTETSNGYYAANSSLASRVAIAFHGNIESANYTAKLDDFNNKEAGEEDITIFEPHATKHTLMGTIDAKKSSTSNDVNTVHPYYGIIAESITPVNRYGTGETEATPQVLKQVTTVTEDAKENTFTVEADSFAKITIYVWIEGQDYDCQNDISNSAFKVDVSFSVPVSSN